MTTTITTLTPQIIELFDVYLLDPLLGMRTRVQKKIDPLFKRKVRDRDIGKIREFNELLIKFQEAYERKKIEEEEYKAKIKNAKKRPSIPTTGATMRFRRF